VGEALRRTLAPLGEMVIPTIAEMDLTDAQAIRRTMRDTKPRWVVNAAAHTAVDKAESEPELAFAINATAPALLAEEARSIGAVMIHYSTDYIFDGSKATRYVESDLPNPLNVYGSSKLAGEVAVGASGAPHMIFRTSWVYGATGSNFVRSILRLAQEREHLRIVADQRGAPTWSFELARMTADVIGQIERRSTQGNCSLAEAMLPFSGVYHATGSGETTWFGFAVQAIAEFQRLELEAKLATVHHHRGVSDCRETAAELAARLLEARTRLRLAHAGLARLLVSGYRRAGAFDGLNRSGEIPRRIAMRSV
jgi:dTDP-4-dehydrorhamnose reductase